MLDAGGDQVTTTGFDVGCHACWSPALHVAAGQLELIVAAHRLPVLLATYIRYRGEEQVWTCSLPRPLTR